MDADLSDAKPSVSTARHPLPSLHRFEKWCEYKGIDRQVPVMCYDDKGGALGASRLWWMLDQLSIEAYVLEGGFQGYCANYAALNLPPPDVTARSEIAAARFCHQQAGAGEEAPNSTFPHVVTAGEIPLTARIIDARPAERFASTIRPMGMDTVPGHVPGAVSHPFPSNLQPSTDGTYQELKPIPVLRQQLAESTGNLQLDTKNCVFMCGSGVTACFNAAVLRHVSEGKKTNPTIYMGSWSEYSGGPSGFQARRSALFQYGVYCEPLKGTKPNPTGPLVTGETKVLIKAGEERTVSRVCDVEPKLLRKTIAEQLREGEALTVTMRTGEQYDAIPEEFFRQLSAE